MLRIANNPKQSVLSKWDFFSNLFTNFLSNLDYSEVTKMESLIAKTSILSKFQVLFQEFLYISKSLFHPQWIRHDLDH